MDQMDQWESAQEQERSESERKRRLDKVSKDAGSSHSPPGKTATGPSVPSAANTTPENGPDGMETGSGNDSRQEVRCSAAAVSADGPEAAAARSAAAGE